MEGRSQDHYESTELSFGHHERKSLVTPQQKDFLKMKRAEGK